MSRFKSSGYVNKKVSCGSAAALVVLQSLQWGNLLNFTQSFFPDAVRCDLDQNVHFFCLSVFMRATLRTCIALEVEKLKVRWKTAGHVVLGNKSDCGAE